MGGLKETLGDTRKVRLREASAEDSAFCLDVRRAAYREYAELDEGWDEGREAESHAERFGRLRFRVVVAEGIDVGFVASAVYGETEAYPASLYLHQLMVLPAFQSRGVGSACVGLLADEARGLGLPLRLRVLRVNPRARMFYERLGFRLVGESATHLAFELTTR